MPNFGSDGTPNDYTSVGTAIGAGLSAVVSGNTGGGNVTNVTNTTQQQQQQQQQTAAQGAAANLPSNMQGFVGGQFAAGLPASASQYVEDESKAYAAQGGKGNPFAGFSIPAGAFGDFMALVTRAETFEATTGWAAFPTPQHLLELAQAGAASWSDQALDYDMALHSGVLTSMPWSALAMTHSQYMQASQSIDEAAMALTGKADWAAAGLDPALKQQALANSWSQTQIQQHMAANSTTMAQYGWIGQGMNYQQWQTHKIADRQATEGRFGQNATDANYLTNLLNPLKQFDAAGGAVGQAPAAPAQAPTTMGRASQVR